VPNLDRSLSPDQPESVENRDSGIAGSREHLQNANFPAFQINAIRKSAAGINRYTQRLCSRIVVSGIPYFLNSKAPEEQT
jgi:hypothetical protein